MVPECLAGDRRRFRCAAVLRFYAVYRAVVRAKIAALRARQEDGQPAQRRSRRGDRLPATGVENRRTASADFGDHLRPVRFGQDHGEFGALLDATLDAAGSIVRLRSDVERKRLFGLAPHDASNSAPDGGIYTAAATQRTYATAAGAGRRAARAGWPVIVDAAFLKRCLNGCRKILHCNRGRTWSSQEVYCFNTQRCDSDSLAWFLLHTLLSARHHRIRFASADTRAHKAPQIRLMA
jgi:hypothetical protein